MFGNKKLKKENFILLEINECLNTVCQLQTELIQAYEEKDINKIQMMNTTLNSIGLTYVARIENLKRGL